MTATTTAANSSRLESSGSDVHRALHDEVLGETTAPASSSVGNDYPVVYTNNKVVLGPLNADQDKGKQRLVTDPATTATPATSIAGNDCEAVVATRKKVLRSCKPSKGKGKATALASSSANAVGYANNKVVLGSRNADEDMDIPGVPDVGTKVVSVPLKMDGDSIGHQAASPTADRCTTPVAPNETGEGSSATAHVNLAPHQDNIEAADLNNAATATAEQPGYGDNNNIAAGDGQDNTAQGSPGATSPNDNTAQEVVQDDYHEIRALQPRTDPHHDRVVELYQRRLASGNPATALQLDPCCTGYSAETYWGPEAPPLNIVGCLGQGGYGNVFLVRDKQQPPKWWALKVFWVGIGVQSGEQWDSWDREGDALVELEGVTGVPYLHAVEDGGGFCYLVMEYMARGDISQLRLTSEEKLRAMLQILWTVHQAHARGYVHHDIKPQNILAHSNGRYYLGDWGLAKKWRDCEQAGGSCWGTRGFEPPEVVQGRKHGPKADVYGIAVTIKVLIDHRTLDDWDEEVWVGELGHSVRARLEWMTNPVPEERPTAIQAYAELYHLIERFWPASDASSSQCPSSPQAGPSHAHDNRQDSTKAAQDAEVSVEVALPPAEQPEINPATDPADHADHADYAAPADPIQPTEALETPEIVLDIGEPTAPVVDVSEPHALTVPASAPTEQPDATMEPLNQDNSTEPLPVSDGSFEVVIEPLEAITEPLEGTNEQLEAIAELLLDTTEPAESDHTAAPLEIVDQSLEAAADLAEPIATEEEPLATAQTTESLEVADEQLEAIAEQFTVVIEPLEATAEPVEDTNEPLEVIAESLVEIAEPAESDQPVAPLEVVDPSLEAAADLAEPSATEEEPLDDAQTTESLQVAQEQLEAIAEQFTAVIEPLVAIAEPPEDAAQPALPAETTEPAQGTEALETTDHDLEATSNSASPAANMLEPADTAEPGDASHSAQPDDLADTAESSEPAATVAPTTAPTTNTAQGVLASTPGQGSTLAPGPVTAPVATTAPTPVPTTTTAQAASTAAPVQDSMLAPAPVSTAPAVVIAPVPDVDLLQDLVFTDYLDVLRQLEPAAVGGGLGAGQSTQNNGPSVQGATLGQGGPSVQANGGNGNGNSNGNDNTNANDNANAIANTADVSSGGGGSAQGSASTPTTGGVGASSSTLYTVTHQMATNFVEEAVMIDTVSGCENYDVVRPKKRNVFKRAADRMRGAFRRLKCT